MTPGGRRVSPAWGVETAWGQNLPRCQINVLRLPICNAQTTEYWSLMPIYGAITVLFYGCFRSFSARFCMNTGGRMAVSGKQGEPDRRGSRIFLSPKLDVEPRVLEKSHAFSRAPARESSEKSGVSVHSDLGPGCPAFALQHLTSPAPFDGDRP